MENCFFCGNLYDPKKRNNKPDPIEIKHTHEGQTYTDKVIVSDDAFYEIVSGPRKGNLVHTWNVVKKFGTVESAV
jgi:hypothetical protein